MSYSQKFRKASKPVLVNNNLCGNIVSSLKLPITFDKRFKVISVPFLFLISVY